MTNQLLLFDSVFVVLSMKQSRRHRSIFYTIKYFVNGNNSYFVRTCQVSFNINSNFISACTSRSLGLPFSAFIEAFFLLSQRKYPTSHSLIDSVSQLVTVCIRQLNNCLQAPASPLIQQSNQYLLHRATRMNTANPNASSFTQRSNIIALRSTTAATHRSMMVPASAPTPRTTHNPQNTTPSATATVSTKSSTSGDNSKQTAKSVFPLFFDVL